MKSFLRTLALLLLLPVAAHATQSSLVTGTFPTSSPYPGLTLVNNINTAMTTITSLSAGSSAPGYAISDMFWADTSNNLLKFTPNGTNFYPVGYFSGGWQATNDGIKLNALASTGSSNAYVVTYAPAAAAYVTGHIYNFITNFANTGSATVNVNGLGATTLKKQGGTNLASGDLGSGIAVSCVYDGTNCQVISQLSTSAAGTMTSVATNNGITGGTITTSGTIGLASQAAYTVLGNYTSGSAVPVGTSAPITNSYGIAGNVSASGTFTGIHSAASSDLSFSANGTDGMTVSGTDQGVTVGSPTGGDKGAGTVNASGLFVGGNPLLSSCTIITGATTATCAGGYTMTGGGCQGACSGTLTGATSYPSSSTTWTCSYGATGGCSSTASAICCH